MPSLADLRPKLNLNWSRLQIGDFTDPLPKSRQKKSISRDLLWEGLIFHSIREAEVKSGMPGHEQLSSCYLNSCFKIQHLLSFGHYHFSTMKSKPDLDHVCLMYPSVNIKSTLEKSPWFLLANSWNRSIYRDPGNSSHVSEETTTWLWSCQFNFCGIINPTIFLPVPSL